MYVPEGYLVYCQNTYLGTSRRHIREGQVAGDSTTPPPTPSYDDAAIRAIVLQQLQWTSIQRGQP